MNNEIVVFWFRRDLRLEDNHGLMNALQSGLPVLPIFIFDTQILGRLDDAYDRRVDYILQALQLINSQLHAHGSSLKTYTGKPLDAFAQLIQEFDVHQVFCNRDYEPETIARDKEIYHFLQQHQIRFSGFKDQVVFEPKEILKKDGLPYTVYTPYAKRWKELLSEIHLATFDSLCDGFIQREAEVLPTLHELGFVKTDVVFQEPQLQVDVIQQYHQTRDFPYLKGTTHLSMALRFGTISVRKCVQSAQQHNEVWLSELIWREFFMQILYHFPKVVTQSFKKQYDAICWRNNESEFKLWCSGNTGYPIVDAGMRELNATGFMHNRVRMITASFLCKHLLIDWRWGEAYFAQKLNDFDLSANNGNWQWVAGSGCDASPYFRVFSPDLQTQKFDKDFKYIKTWVPEFDSCSYSQPIVNHKEARERALEVYGKAMKATD